MDHNTETLHLVRRASVGDKESMQQLLEVTRPRLFSYLMRLTMDYHLAEDILQEVQTEILTSLWRLNKTNRFWPWIYKHAWGKVRHHYRDTRKHKAVFLSEMEKDFFDEQIHTIEREANSVANDTQTELLFETMYGAMKNIGLKPRNVLTMRCFEEMSFLEISEFLDCSETNARVLFFRAKRKLKSQLRRKGFQPGKMFLPALGLFGALTSKTASAGTPATVAVSTQSVEVGFAASFIGFLTTKMGLFLSGILSTALAWFTLTHLILIAVITIILMPIIYVLLLSAACNNE
ncbi:MAG: sigma-70 family RNA polymerase sigma factor [Planctomycetes bacterium]|nr:sigma-70 family RNA polymerase sigma factor [Planctomycetota bacterium]